MLFGSDPRVMTYARAVTCIFLEAGLDVYLQSSLHPSANSSASTGGKRGGAKVGNASSSGVGGTSGGGSSSGGGSGKDIKPEHLVSLYRLPIPSPLATNPACCSVS